MNERKEIVNVSRLGQRTTLPQAKVAFQAPPQLHLTPQGRVTGGQHAEGEPEQAGEKRTDAEGRYEQNQALAAADRLLAPSTGLYRKGPYPAEGRLLLYFHFPAVARERYAEEIRCLAAKTGWRVKVHEGVHQGELVAAARRALGPAARLQREPSVHLEEGAVRVRLAYESAGLDPAMVKITTAGGVSDEQVASVVAVYFEKTRYRLVRRP